MQKDQNEKKNTREQIRVFFFMSLHATGRKEDFMNGTNDKNLYLILTEYDSND